MGETVADEAVSDASALHGRLGSACYEPNDTVSVSVCLEEKAADMVGQKPEQLSNAQSNPSGRQHSQLEQLAKLTGELAHEIKNPLSTIKVNLKLAQEQLSERAGSDPQTARALRKIQVVQQETDRLQRILDGFLKYIGKPELDLSPTCLNTLVGDLIDFCWPQLQAQGITLRHSQCEETLTVNIDASTVKQVLLNMILNAQQAMDQGGELIIQTQRHGEQAAILISDTGPGIQPVLLNRIFAPYFSTKPKGTGLGLAIAKKIIEAHHGSMAVESEPGKGTRFTVELPLYKTPDGRMT